MSSVATRPIIETRALFKSFGLLPVLRGLDLAVAREGDAVFQPFGVGDEADLNEHAFEFDLVQFVLVAVLVAEARDLLAVAEHVSIQKDTVFLGENLPASSASSQVVDPDNGEETESMKRRDQVTCVPLSPAGSRVMSRRMMYPVSEKLV